MKPGILLASILVAISLQLCTAISSRDGKSNSCTQYLSNHYLSFYMAGYEWERPYIQQADQERDYFEDPTDLSVVQEEGGPTESDAYAYPFCEYKIPVTYPNNGSQYCLIHKIHIVSQ